MAIDYTEDPGVPTSMKGRFWSLVGTHTMNDFQVGASAALLPYFVTEQHYSYAAVAGLTLAATSISSVAEPAFGFLSDRFPLRPLILIGMLTAALGIAGAGLVSSNYALTWIAFAVSGIGVAAYHPSATVHAKETGGGTNRSMSTFSVGGNVGAAIAPILVGLTVGIFGLNATPLLLIPAVTAAIVYLVFHRQRGVGAELGNHAKLAATDSHRPHDLWARFGWLLLVVCLWSTTFIGTRSFLALYLAQRFHADDTAGTIALTIYTFAATFGTLTGGFLADRIGRRAVIVAGYFSATIMTGAIVMAPNYGVAVTFAAIAGFVLFLPFALHVTLAHAYLPRHLGTASGLALGLSTTVGGLLSPILGLIADASSIQTVFIILAIITFLAFICSLFVRERAYAETHEDCDPPVDARYDKTLD